MSVPPLPVSLDELKKLVVQLLVCVSAQEEEIQQLRAENSRLKDLPKKPKLAPGDMDKATEPNKRARTKQARRQRRKRQSGRRTPPVTTERTLVIEAPGGLAAPRLRALHCAGTWYGVFFYRHSPSGARNLSRMSLDPHPDTTQNPKSILLGPGECDLSQETTVS
jgi:hypothetical protein